MKALLSVYDKTGLTELARSLSAADYELVSTGGTAAHLSAAGLPVTQVADLTGFPEMLDGRVKTLHPIIHAGILARRDIASHRAEIASRGIDTIDIVVGNLYPFAQTVSQEDAELEDALENIDIGGPTMLRSAAKNFPSVLTLTDPSDYDWVRERISDGGEFETAERRELAQKAFQHVALYDTTIARYLAGDSEQVSWPELTFGYHLRLRPSLRRKSASERVPILTRSLQRRHRERESCCNGIDMSYTNYLDADAAWRIVSDFAETAVVVVKHTNACGLAVHRDQQIAYSRAFEGDSVSAYGGIVGFNRPVTADTANAMRGVLYDIIAAPGYEADALKILRRRRRTRILEVEGAIGPCEGLEIRPVSGGALVQSADDISEDPSTWKVVTQRAPTEAQLRDMAFAWKAAKHIKSNTIVLAKEETLVGMGAGQPNRVTSVRLALEISGDKANGSVMASDAFFPFADSIEMAAQGGIGAVVQPGGSIRDDECVEAANRLDIVMMFTGTRHFRH